MKQFDIKIYGQSKATPEYKALSDFVIAAKSAKAAGLEAQSRYLRIHRGMKITHVEIGGCRQIPGYGKKLPEA